MLKLWHWFSSIVTIFVMLDVFQHLTRRVAIGQVTHDGVEMRVLNEDLAEGANVTLFTVSRCLRDWERAGILAKRRGKILLRKPELLLTAR